MTAQAGYTIKYSSATSSTTINPLAFGSQINVNTNTPNTRTVQISGASTSAFTPTLAQLSGMYVMCSGDTGLTAPRMLVTSTVSTSIASTCAGNGSMTGNYQSAFSPVATSSNPQAFNPWNLPGGSPNNATNTLNAYMDNSSLGAVLKFTPDILGSSSWTNQGFSTDITLTAHFDLFVSCYPTIQSFMPLC